MSQPITNLTIEVLDASVNPDPIATPYISGNVNVNLQTGVSSWSSGSNKITVEIPSGFEVGDKLYVPVLPADFSARKLRLEFRTSANPSVKGIVTVPGESLQASKVYTISAKVPLRINFKEEGGSLQNAGLSGSSANPFTFKGYQFYRNSTIKLENQFVGFPARGSGSNAPVLVLPLDVRTMSNRGNIPVRIWIWGNGGGAWLGSSRQMYYAAVATPGGTPANISFSGPDHMTMEGADDTRNGHTAETLISLTSSTPCVGLSFNGPSSTYTSRVEALEVWPEY